MRGSTSKRLIVIAGPTATGKTRVAIELAKALKTEIISADSRQMYKEMSVGTAKPSSLELAEAKHHFIGFRSVHEEYDAGQYERDALKLLYDLFAKYDNLLLCGGSGMYIRAVCEGFDEMPPVEESVRKQIIADYQAKGLTWLQEQVMENDPDYFAEVDQKNPQRLMRALEIVRSTGKAASEFRKKKTAVRDFDIVKIGLELPREDLYERINQRVDSMLQSGLLDEAKGLYQFKNLNALQTVGYQELFDYLEGKYDLEEAVRLIKRNTRRYAKRQLTWFKKDTSMKWFHPNDVRGILSWINE